MTSGDNTAVPASRTARLSRIRALIRSEQISSQAELARRLAGEGIVVSQGTLSRDLKDAGAEIIWGISSTAFPRVSIRPT